MKLIIFALLALGACRTAHAVESTGYSGCVMIAGDLSLDGMPNCDSDCAVDIPTSNNGGNAWPVQEIFNSVV